MHLHVQSMYGLRGDNRLTGVKRISNISTGYLRCGETRHQFPSSVAGFFDDVYFAMTHAVRRQITYLLGPICPIFCYVDSICVKKSDAKGLMERMATTQLTFVTHEYKRIYVAKPTEYIVETVTGEYIVKGCSHDAKEVMTAVLIESRMFDEPLTLIPASIGASLSQYHHTLSHQKSTTTSIYCPFRQETTPRPAFGRTKSCPLCRTVFVM